MQGNLSEVNAVAAVGQLAASANNGGFAYAVPLCNKVAVVLSAEYAAVAATSGLQMSFTVSENNGSSYAASAQANVVCAPAAGVLGSQTVVFSIRDMAAEKDGGGVTNIKVTITNLDATNAANYALQFVEM